LGPNKKAGPAPRKNAKEKAPSGARRDKWTWEYRKSAKSKANLVREKKVRVRPRKRHTIGKKKNFRKAGEFGPGRNASQKNKQIS